MNSKLQIISGKFRGRKLYLPPNARPTQQRARAALFNMLASGVVGTDGCINVWDAFAGSGAFGIEFISRYPNAKVVFTDVAKESLDTIRRNLAMLGVGNSGTVVAGDAVALGTRFGMNSDVVFVDAPYSDADVARIFVANLTRVARPGTILIWEQENEKSINAPDGWGVLRDKKYGRARFLILQRTTE